MSQAHYTAQEIIAIIQEAKASGVSTIKLPNFEATLTVGKVVAKPEPAHTREEAPESREGVRAVEKQRQNGLGWCDKHDWRLIKGRYGPYCTKCWRETLDAKEAKENSEE